MRTIAFCFDGLGERFLIAPGGPRNSWLTRLGICLILLLLGVSDGWALEVRSVRWGFTNTIHPSAFNLCTLEVYNDTRDPFSGPLTMFSIHGGSRLEDLPSVLPEVYLGPGETRTVQFVIYLQAGYQSWELRSGLFNRDRAELPQMPGTTTAKDVVQLDSLRDLASRIEGLELFEEANFPSGAPGTSGLGIVVLDHVPKWDTARRQAFRDWLGAGGQLYLLNGREGPTTGFSTPLEELNIPADEFAVGQGVVRRRAPIGSVQEIPEIAAAIQATLPNPNGNSYNESSQGMSGLLSLMRDSVRPQHNWPLIFFLSVIYLLVLFPGVWIYSRKRGDYRVTYGLVLGTVLLFSWFFAEIGRRGYQSDATLQSSIVARPLGNGRVLLDIYSNQFVTAGGERPLSGLSESSAFTLDPGTAFSGTATVYQRPQSGIMVDIPPYSSCSYYESTVRPASGDYSIKAVPNASGEGSLRVELGTAFPAETEVYLLVNDSRVAPLSRAENGWVLNGGWKPLGDQFPVTPQYRWNRLSPEEQQKSQTGHLVGLATQLPVVTYNQWGENPSPTADATPVDAASIDSGTLLMLLPTPSELRPEGSAATSRVVFVHPVNPLAAPGPSPTVPATAPTP